MPIYEFECSKCGSESEMLVKTTDWSDAKCPDCGSTSLEKKLSTFSPAGADSGHNDAPPCGLNPGSCGGCCGSGM
ncbi:MAG: zinc ribbon domain-containing protein [Verrucomicrobia bacterium]|nr:zinc ribbon domain-containing protein [Verrucomicrobiota bacterium]